MRASERANEKLQLIYRINAPKHIYTRNVHEMCTEKYIIYRIHPFGEIMRERQRAYCCPFRHYMRFVCVRARARVNGASERDSSSDAHVGAAC